MFCFLLSTSDSPPDTGTVKIPKMLHNANIQVIITLVGILISTCFNVQWCAGNVHVVGIRIGEAVVGDGVD